MLHAACSNTVQHITSGDFDRIATWLRETAGINLSPQKKPLVMGRLAPRVRHYGLDSYGAYVELLLGGSQPDELQIALDLLTTNETHFFREPRHFDLLKTVIAPQRQRTGLMRVWSAASSSGEEPYSIAMTLAATLGDTPWEVLASDVSRRMLQRAAAGHYPMSRARSIPSAYLFSYCLKGIGSQEGTFIIDPDVRKKVQFRQLNLVHDLPPIGEFEVIFLRNVMIYFDDQTKRKVLRRAISRLPGGGYLIIGHSESLNGLTDEVSLVAPSIYRKP